MNEGQAHREFSVFGIDLRGALALLILLTVIGLWYFSNKSFADTEYSGEIPPARQEWHWEDLAPRARVRVAGFSELGVIRRVNRERNLVEVTLKAMNLRVPTGHLLAVFPPMDRQEQLYATSVSVEQPLDPKQELDIHGMTVDDMIPLVEKYVDEAFRGGFSSVRIIHGYGTGRLRQAVRKLLGENPVVQCFSNGTDFEGGAGVTIVSFRPTEG